jgi:hypothetical protein
VPEELADASIAAAATAITFLAHSCHDRRRAAASDRWRLGGPVQLGCRRRALRAQQLRKQ